VIAALGVGAGVSFQHSFNGHVNIQAKSPVTAALMNFIVGTTVLYIILGGGIATGHFVFTPLPSSPAYLYLGGLFGLLFIITAARVIKVLGSLRFAMGSVTGQLVGSLILDIVVPTNGSKVSVQLIAAIGLTAIAVLLANSKPTIRS
jgi:transporter family-2 protein